MNRQKNIEKEIIKIQAKVRLEEIEKEFCEKIKKASISENCDAMINLFYELNILRKFYRKKCGLK